MVLPACIIKFSRGVTEGEKKTIDKELTNGDVRHGVLLLGKIKKM